MSQSEQRSQSYPTRNEFKLTRQDNVVRIRIAATSPEMAQKIYELVERHCIAIGRAGLESKWDKG